MNYPNQNPYPQGGYPQQPQQGFPQQQPQGYPNQGFPGPGQPQQAPQGPGGWPQQDQQPQQGWGGQAPGAYPPQGPGGFPQGVPHAQPAAQMQGPSGLPVIHRADPALIQAAHRKAQEEAERVAKARAGGGGKGRWWNPPGPNGQDKWGSEVPVTFSSRSLIQVCPPWGQGGAFWMDDESHFWKCARAPQGTSIACPGQARCPVCFASKLLYKSGRKDDAVRARFGRQRKQAIFQILLLEHPQSHWDQATGKMTPWLFRASSQAKKGILDVFESRMMERLGDMTDPNSGGPVWITKTKTGTEKMDVEWNVQRSESRPLHQAFWPALHNLWDLSKFVVPAMQQDMVQCLQEIGLPFTPEVQQLLAGIPMGQPAQGAPQQGGMPPQQMQLPQGQMGGYPQPGPQQPYQGGPPMQQQGYPQQPSPQQQGYPGPQNYPQQGGPGSGPGYSQQQNLHQQLRG